MTPRTALPFLASALKMAGRHGWLTALLWLVVIAPAQAALELRVAIEENVPSVKVGSSVDAVVRDAASGQVLGNIQGMNGFEAQRGGRGIALDKWTGNSLSIEPKDPNGVVWIGSRWYRGKAVLVPTGSGLTAVNRVDLEQYLYSVLGGEMNGNWNQEALKAQAVAARSYALYRRNRDGNGVFDLCDTAQCQVYRGVQDESAGTQAAVNATAGQVLTYKGKIIEALFHSSSGGATENVEDVWGSYVPYLRAVTDYDETAPVFQWSKTYSQNELSNLISGVGQVRDVQPVGQPTAGGRYRKMRIVGDRGQRDISTEDLRDALSLRSSKFTIVSQFDQTKSNNKQRATSFVVQGRGFGHGLGMSQYGALGLANRGLNYQQIVLHYYQGTQLAKIDVR